MDREELREEFDKRVEETIQEMKESDKVTIIEQPLQDSFTTGTAATGGSIKIYFNASDLKEAQAKLENGLKIITFLKGLGVEIGGKKKL